MGDFIGHIDEAVIFLIMFLWWMYKGFTKHIEASLDNKQYVAQMSYLCKICNRGIPMEQVLKVLFPLGALIAEGINSTVRPTDGEGRQTAANHWMHITIYGLFVVHGIVDWLQIKGYKFIAPKMDFLSIAFAFLWYGMGMYYHAHMDTKSPLENSVHLQAVFPQIGLSVVFFCMAVWTSTFIFEFVRIYFLGLLGTWVAHSSFILYKPDLTPGHPRPNPAWDRKDMNNMHYVQALFGYHMIFNLVFLFFMYGICYWCVSRNRNSNGYTWRPNTDKDPEAAQKLLE